MVNLWTPSYPRVKPAQHRWSRNDVPAQFRRLWEDVEVAIPFWEGAGDSVWDVASTSEHTVTGAPPWAMTKRGWMMDFEQGTDELDYTPIPDYTSTYTIMILIQGDNNPPTSIQQVFNWAQSSGTTSKILFSWGHSNAAFRQAWALNDGSWGAVKYTTTLVANTPYVICARHDGTTLNIFLDGIKDTPTSTRVPSSSNHSYVIGSGNGTSYYDGKVGGFIHWAKPLPDAAIYVASRNMLKLFDSAQRQRSRIFGEAAAAAGADELMAAMQGHSQPLRVSTRVISY